MTSLRRRLGGWWRHSISLEPGETVIAETLAVKTSWGHLYLTDRRLIWSRETFGYGPRTASIPFSEIEALTFEKGTFGRAINIRVGKFKYYAFTVGSFWFLLGDAALPFLWHRLFAKADTTEKWFSLIQNGLSRSQRSRTSEEARS